MMSQFITQELYQSGLTDCLALEFPVIENLLLQGPILPSRTGVVW